MKGGWRRRLALVGALVAPAAAGPWWQGAAGATRAVVSPGAQARPGTPPAGPARALAARLVPGGAQLTATPLLSPARLPLTLEQRWADDTLVESLARSVSAAVIGRAASAASCVVVAIGGRTVYSYHGELPALPASNMKLLTATALLDRLGPAYRFTTELVVARRPVGGIVHGNLYLVGGGDPLLRTPAYADAMAPGGGTYTDVDAFAALVRAAGVRRVSGSVVGDESRYDTQRTVPSWLAVYSEEGDVGPLSALSVDDGFALAGRPVPGGAPPPLQAAGLVSEVLRSGGVVVAGAPEMGRAPAHGLVLARLVSPPLSQELGEALRESDNTALELMTKELGRSETGRGTTAAGTAAVRADLAADGLSTAGLVNVDGSGLSRLDRVSCDLLVGVLQRSGPHGVLSRDLPVAGESGTLAHEMIGTPAYGRVEAKTGTLLGVKALSGWVLPAAARPGAGPGLAQPVAFSALFNDLAVTGPAPAAQVDAVAEDIARYPTAPALASFEPGLGRPGATGGTRRVVAVVRERAPTG